MLCFYLPVGGEGRGDLCCRFQPLIPPTFCPRVRGALRPGHGSANKTRTPIVYRLCSRPIAGTMGIIERANYDSEKLLERGIPASIRVCKPRRRALVRIYSFSCLRKMARRGKKGWARGRGVIGEINLELIRRVTGFFF